MSDDVPEVSEVLKRQRQLASQTLQRASDHASIRPVPSPRQPPRSRGRHRSINITELEEDQTIHLESTPQKCSLEPHKFTTRSINITELEEDQTIHLESTPQKCSFEPHEFTARSTMVTGNAGKFLSAGIEDVLASSFAANIRSIGSSLRESLAGGGQEVIRPDVSLPRTADLSRLSRDSLLSLASGVGRKDFWDLSQPAFETSGWMRDRQNELSALEEVSFRPAESERSRLQKDELAWERENADIPTTEAQTPVRNFPAAADGRKPNKLQDHVELSCFSGFLTQDGGDQAEADASFCSVGQYFNKMSDDLCRMMPGQSPPRRTPRPLVDMTNDCDEGSHKSPQKDRKKQTAPGDKENSISLSYIAKAISNTNLEESPHNLVQRIMQVQRSKSGPIAAGDGSTSKRPEPAARSHVRPNLATLVEQTPVPKQRQPATGRPEQLCDTIPFTDSLLESSCFPPDLPLSKTSSPKTSPTIATVTKKPLLDTYRVSTATKMLDEQLELPPIPMIRNATPRCQKNIFDTDGPTKPCRKQRSNSAARPVPVDKQFDHLAVTSQKRSKSPTNRAEMLAVAGANLHLYQDTPRAFPPHNKRNAAPHQNRAQKSFLLPEPRRVPLPVSPFTSPKSVGYGGHTERRSEMVPSTESGALRSVPPVRSISQCSLNSNGSERDAAILPLKATHSELSWGSIRLRKSEKKVMQIKNISNRKLLIRAIIVGPGFQLCGTEQSGTLTLQSQECRTITVDFCPTVIGAAVGALSFHPPNETYIQRVVSLYGYGGEASLKIEGIQKGPSGPFLELGSARNLSRPLEKTFSLYNKGSLPAFARIDIDMKGLDQALLASSVFVQPQKVIVPSNSYAHIKVVFKPQRQEIAKILQKRVDVLSITNLHILWGDEPTRHRIRKNISLAKRNELQPQKIAPLESMWDGFANEPALSELDLFSEHLVETIHELFLTFKEYELVLTIDRGLDESMIDLSMEDENSALFKTMYISSEAGSPRLPDEVSPALSAVHSAKRESGESWSVRPTALEFRQSTERTKQFVIKSNFYTIQYFELNSNYRQLFQFSPAEGHIRPGQEVVVNVSLQTMQAIQPVPISIVVFIENEQIAIPVYIQSGR